MTSICKCPANAALESIVLNKCATRVGQIQRAAFQRRAKDDGSANSFSEETIKTLAAWQTALTAKDSTKIVVTPWLEAPNSEPGDARTVGGGNDSLNGTEIVTGHEPDSMDFVMNNQDQATTIKSMRSLECEARAHSLGVFLFDEFGGISCLKTENGYEPIPIERLFIGGKQFGNLENNDSNAMSFQIPPYKTDDLVHIMPSFDPLTELVTYTE